MPAKKDRDALFNGIELSTKLADFTDKKRGSLDNKGARNSVDLSHSSKSSDSILGDGINHRRQSGHDDLVSNAEGGDNEAAKLVGAKDSEGRTVE